jgi:hypothetical protein
MAWPARDDGVFELQGETTPETLELAKQSADERAGALGIQVSVVDVTGRVVYVTEVCHG